MLYAYGHNQDVSFVHDHAAESDDDTRKYLAAQFPELKKIFPTIQSLARKKAINCLSDTFEVAEVARVFLFLSGFVCTDTSVMNVRRQ